MNKENYNKVMNLINDNNTKLDMGVINTIINSLLQRRFRLDQDDYTIFARFERLLSNNNDSSISEVNRLLYLIEKTINVPSLINKDSLDIVKLFNHDKEEINLLHKLTNAYILKRRETYIVNNLDSSLKKLDIDKYYN